MSSPVQPTPTVPSPYGERLSAIPTTLHEVDLLGSTTRYWEYGSPDADVTLLAIHGFRGDHHGLEPIIAYLVSLADTATPGPAAGEAAPRPSIRVLAPDLPGFGVSDPLPGREHGTDSYAEWLFEFGERIGLGPETVVLGHSFGSIVTSAAFARGLPAAKLVLVNPIAAPALKGPRGILSRLAVAYYWAGARLPETAGHGILKSRFVTRVISLAMVKTKSKPLRAWVHDQHDVYFSRFATRQVVLEAFRASVSTDVSTYARDIHAPVLLIAADRDDVTALPAQYELQQRFDDAQLDVIHGVGHLIHYEKPLEAATLIQDFVR